MQVVRWRAATEFAAAARADEFVRVLHAAGDEALKSLVGPAQARKNWPAPSVLSHAKRAQELLARAVPVRILLDLARWRAFPNDF